MKFLCQQLHCLNTGFSSIQYILNLLEIELAEEITNLFSRIRFRCIYFSVKMVGEAKHHVTQCLRVMRLCVCTRWKWKWFSQFNVELLLQLFRKFTANILGPLASYTIFVCIPTNATHKYYRHWIVLYGILLPFAHITVRSTNVLFYILYLRNGIFPPEADLRPNWNINSS